MMCRHVRAFGHDRHEVTSTLHDESHSFHIRKNARSAGQNLPTSASRDSVQGRQQSIRDAQAALCAQRALEKG